MQVPISIFREYDIRGIVGEQITPEFAEHLGRAVASKAMALNGRPPTLVVGRDNRPSGGQLSSALRQGIVLSGGSAVDVGELPTPALYFAVEELDADGGIQITGSHNPPAFNGFKMVVKNGAMHGEAIQDLYQQIMLEQYENGSGSDAINSTILPRYRDAILSRHQLERPVKVVVDCGNGVSSLIAVETLRALGAEVIPLFAESDGSFPNHHPDPTVLANLVDLQAFVRAHGAELGIAFDGDGDRIGVVDESAQPVFGDQLLIILGRDCIERLGAGIPIIFDVKCSDQLPVFLEAAGARPIMWKTGHSLIKAKMSEENAPLAGEMSGHMFFGGDWFGFDDALFAAARLLEIVSRQPAGLSALLRDVPRTISTPEIRIDCPDDRKFSIVEDATEYFSKLYPVNNIDGIRVSWPDGWGLLRASNTQAVLVLRFEATSQAALDGHRTEFFNWLAERGIDV